MTGPKMIERRVEADHWEGDLIICKRTRPVLVLAREKIAHDARGEARRKDCCRDHFRHARGVRPDRSGLCASPPLSIMIPLSPSTLCFEPCAT